MKYAQIFPITTGWVIGKLETGLNGSGQAYASGVTIARVRPAILPAKLVTVRDDSGPQDGTQARRRYGINVWAASSVDSEKIALLCQAILRAAPDGNPVTATDEFAGPFSVEDDPTPTSGNQNLAHYYFTFRLSVRASNF